MNINKENKPCHVKILQANTSVNLEKQINDYLVTNPNVSDIKFTHVETNTGATIQNRYTAYIIYFDKS